MNTLPWASVLPFLLVWIPAVATPGINAVFSITAGVRFSFSRALFAPLGLACASFVYGAATSLGLTLVLAAIPDFLTLLRYGGGTLMLWYAWRTWRHAWKVGEGHVDSTSRGMLLLQGLTISISNPQAMLAYLLLMGPFVTGDAPWYLYQVTVVPAAALAVFSIYCLYALFGIQIRRFLRNPAGQRVLRIIVVIVYCAIALGFYTGTI
ncbi:MAG: LysE family translocator [Pseudomonadota bacterium]